MAAMENYFEKSDDIKVQIEELELLMDPQDSEVCLRKILTHVKKERQQDFSRSSVQAEIVGWRQRKEGSIARKVAKRVARRKLRRKGVTLP